MLHFKIESNLFDSLVLVGEASPLVVIAMFLLIRRNGKKHEMTHFDIFQKLYGKQ